MISTSGRKRIGRGYDVQGIKWASWSGEFPGVEPKAKSLLGFLQDKAYLSFS